MCNTLFCVCLIFRDWWLKCFYRAFATLVLKMLSKRFSPTCLHEYIVKFLRLLKPLKKNKIISKYIQNFYENSPQIIIIFIKYFPYFYSDTWEFGKKIVIFCCFFYVKYASLYDSCSQKQILCQVLIDFFRKTKSG